MGSRRQPRAGDAESGCVSGAQPQDSGAPERRGGHASGTGGVKKRIDGGGAAEDDAARAGPVTGAERLMVHGTDFDPRDAIGGGDYWLGGGQGRVRGHWLGSRQAALVWTSPLARRRRTDEDGMAGAGRPGSSICRRRSNWASR